MNRYHVTGPAIVGRGNRAEKRVTQHVIHAESAEKAKKKWRRAYPQSGGAELNVVRADPISPDAKTITMRRGPKT